jgi:hypothetical protein
MMSNPEQQVLGRDSAEYHDDSRCSTCNKWFRKHELLNIPRDELAVATGTLSAWGLCPICKGKVYP